MTHSWSNKRNIPFQTVGYSTQYLHNGYVLISSACHPVTIIGYYIFKALSFQGGPVKVKKDSLKSGSESNFLG